jgi:hypothetical protein
MWFVPSSALTAEQRRTMPTEVAARTPGALLQIAQTLRQTIVPAPTPIEGLCLSERASSCARTLGHLFDKFGSDKSTTHNYHYLYGFLLSNLPNPYKLLEIGLGSNNTSIPSNMGELGRPGASLRAFKEFSPDSEIVGADIDSTISVEKCSVFHVDQLRPESFASITKGAGYGFDLIIDDGLHSPDANLNTLHFALRHLSPGGFVVVEDIPQEALPIWGIVQTMIAGTQYRSLIFRCKIRYAFVMTSNASFWGFN